MDLDNRKKDLQTRIIVFTWIGGISAGIALIPLIWAGYDVFQSHSFYKENELGDFIGGTSGTFASFAGLAFVYVGFLGQQLQILMQQEELEMNRQELKDTREEIKGQKEQLELQNKQFQIQSFETVFFQLLRLYKEKLSNSFPPNGEVPLAFWVDFTQKLEHQIKNFDESDMSRDDLINERNMAFEESFKSKESEIESLIKSVYGICIHIYSNKTLINERYYQDVLYRQLEMKELNLYFYGYFSRSGLYEPLFERIFAKFLKTINPQKILVSTDKIFLKEIPTPDDELDLTKYPDQF